MNIKSTNEQLLGNYGACKNNQLEQSNTIKNSDNVEITKDKIVSKKDSNDNYLKLGDNGSEISQLQTLLKNSGHLKSAVNGYYGKETEDAVKSFQKSRGLKETGVIDLTTKVAIAESRDVAKSVAYSTVAEAPMRRAKRSVDLTAGIGLAGVGASTAGVAAGGVAATGGVASSWNENVYYLQVLCNQYGVSVDTDGIWGKNTESAVKQLPQLSYGSNEGAVYHIQNVLKIPADGKFGSATKAAVENWQRQHGLTADGIVGADTWISFSGFKPIGNSLIDAAIQLGGVGAPSSSALKLDVSSEQATQWLQILCNQMGIRDNSGNLLPQNGEMTWGTVEAMNKLPMLSTSTGNSYLGAVKHIQNLLKINADGYYGSDTAKAVRFWQTAHGISSDGIVGHDTWETFAGQKFIARNENPTPPVTKPDTQEEKPNSLMDKIKSIPEYADIISEEVQENPRDFAIGILKSLDENGYGGTASWIVNKFNLGSLEGDSVSYMTGKVIGDAASTATGVATILGGIAQEAIGISADGTGVLAPVGVSLNAAGALTISYGTTVATVSSKNGMEDAGKLFEKCDNIYNESQVGLPSSRSIDDKVLKELKGMGLDKKFKAAMEKGLAPRRVNTSGVIKLTKGEIKVVSGYEYTYKIKVSTAGAHTRVYGRMNEAGELIFDLIKKK